MGERGERNLTHRVDARVAALPLVVRESRDRGKSARLRRLHESHRHTCLLHHHCRSLGAYSMQLPLILRMSYVNIISSIIGVASASEAPLLRRALR